MMYSIIDEENPLGNNILIKNRLTLSRFWRRWDITMPESKCPQKLVKRYPYKRITKEQWDMIKFYYRLGYSVRMIGRCYGYHESNIIARAKKEGWLFNDLGILVNKAATALCNLKIVVQEILENNKTTVHLWYIILKRYNTLLQVGGCDWLLFSVNKEIKFGTKTLCNIPSKFIPTLADIEREKSSQSKLK